MLAKWKFLKKNLDLLFFISIFASLKLFIDCKYELFNVGEGTLNNDDEK